MTFDYYDLYPQDRHAHLLCRFMWVRAQVDYLQRLPTDKEKRIALQDLPPDLPQTYVRIFEIIDSTYPIQTTKLIQRLLKWLILEKACKTAIHDSSHPPYMTSRMLSQAICVENESDRLSNSEIPTKQQILGWLGCLVRRTKHEEMIELSHFTIKEFLRMDPEKVSSAVARKYLVQSEDYNYLLQVCLNYLMHDDFRSMPCSNPSEIRSLVETYPLFDHAVQILCDYVRELIITSTGMNEEVQSIMRKFLSVPVHRAFRLWGKFWTGMSETFISPLHFASATGLVDDVERLLKLGLDPNGNPFPATAMGFGYTPLHLALLSDDFFLNDGLILLDLRDVTGLDIELKPSLQTMRTLLEAGADVNRQFVLRRSEDDSEFIVSPLTLAVMCRSWRAACILLDGGADCDARAHDPSVGEDLCSIEAFLEEFWAVNPEFEESVKDFIDRCEHQGLKLALERWQDRQMQLEGEYNGQGIEESNGHSMENINYSASAQERFIDAYRNGKWSVVRELLEPESGIEINCIDEQGTNPLYCLANGDSEDLRYLLERGANPNLLSTEGNGALSKTVVDGCLENMSLLLEFGANIEHRDPTGWVPLLYAIWFGRHDMVERLLNEGAYPDAVLDNGTGGIHLAVQKKDTAMFSLLLEHGLTASVDPYGSTPLHEACDEGLQFEVEKLIQAAPDRINDSSLHFGTPLYTAAGKDFVSVVQALLDAGAAIDKTGPGNLLGSALLVACAQGRIKTVNLLLFRGASREVEGSRFFSAAGTARAFRQEKIIKILEEYSHNLSETEQM